MWNEFWRGTTNVGRGILAVLSLGLTATFNGGIKDPTHEDISGIKKLNLSLGLGRIHNYPLNTLFFSFVLFVCFAELLRTYVGERSIITAPPL